MCVGCFSLTRPTPLSTSQPSSCLSPSSISATSSSRSSTRRTWKTCATPLTTGVRAPTTSSTSPQVMSPTAHDFDELQNSSVPLSFKIPIADQDVDDLTLGKMLTEAYRGQVDYFVQGGVSVSQLSSSVRSDRSGQPDGDRSGQPDERESSKAVVDSGASMHLLSRKDLNSAKLETVGVSQSPTTVVTASGEVQTKKEATVYVKELDTFVTVKLLKETPAVLSLGKRCEDHGYSHEWTSGQKPQLIKDGRRTKCNTENYVPIVVPGLSTSSSSSATPTSPTSISQEAAILTLHPASTRSERTSSTVRGKRVA